jgi:hypothetical protein
MNRTVKKVDRLVNKQAVVQMNELRDRWTNRQTVYRYQMHFVSGWIMRLYLEIDKKDPVLSKICHLVSFL